MKTYKGKYKKAANGLQSVAVPQQGSTSNVMSSATSMAAAGSQFGPWGTIAGGALGLATGMYQKDAEDKANMLAVNKNKYLSANRAVDGVDDSVDQKTQVFKAGGNVVVNGKPKYRRADGKVVKRGLWSNTYLSKKEDGMSTMKEGTKMIEIEGKGTPEIHTDKNFNVKNLGTTPHTKGGNKVEASEGDIVFNTQNSLAKYNKIASAIENGDKATLTKEKNKLPDDGGDKKQQGDKDVQPGKPVAVMNKSLIANRVKTQPTKLSSKRPVNPDGAFPRAIDKAVLGTFKRMGEANTRQAKAREAALGIVDNAGTAQMKSATPATVYNPSNPLSIPGIPKPQGSIPTSQPTSIPTSQPISQPAIKSASKSPVGKQGKKISAKTVPVVTPSVPAVTKPAVDQTPFAQQQNRPTTPMAGTEPSTPITRTPDPTPPSPDKPNTPLSSAPKSNTGANIAQFAGVANNLYQGLKPEVPIPEQYFDPQLNKYTDRSESMRQQSVSAMNVQNANARNVSGGNAGNLRANQNQAALGNVTRQDAINEQEITRKDAIDNSNTGLKNAAGQFNLQRKDMYQGQIDGGRAAKEAFIGQAASDIGKYGQLKNQETYLRSRDDKLAASDLAGYTALSGGQHFRNLDGTAGFNPLGTTGGGYMSGRGGQRTSTSAIGLNGLYPNSYNKDGSVITENAKGVKAVKVKSKYKMK